MKNAGGALRAGFVLNEKDGGEAYQEDTPTRVRRSAVRKMPQPFGRGFDRGNGAVLQRLPQRARRVVGSHGALDLLPVAGPQVAAALLIFSQIFKKPLQEATQVYYGIGGTFDEPDIQSITPEVFALSGAMAGCVVEDDS